MQRRDLTAGPNGLDPNMMTPAERIAEVCRILAAGLVRLHARKSTRLSADLGESSLDTSADRSGHARVAMTRGNAQ
jgi:hypothetical protein